MKNVLNSKEFWKIIRPFLSDKNPVFSEISKEKKNQIIPDEFDLSEKFSTLFKEAVKSVSVKPDEYYLSDPVEFENHPSVQVIEQNISVN